MTYLVDTNVLLRIIQVNHSLHADAIRAAATLGDQGHELVVIGQNLIEFWAVATRPLVNNGLALTISETAAHLTTFQRTFTLLPDTPDIFSGWAGLVELHSVVGRQAHDARLAAAMLAHGVSHLLTFNDADFKRYNEITIVNPQNVAQE